MVEISDAFVVLPGGFGTLEELVTVRTCFVGWVSRWPIVPRGKLNLSRGSRHGLITDVSAQVLSSSPSSWSTLTASTTTSWPGSPCLRLRKFKMSTFRKGTVLGLSPGKQPCTLHDGHQGTPSSGGRQAQERHYGVAARLEHPSSARAHGARAHAAGRTSCTSESESESARGYLFRLLTPVRVAARARSNSSRSIPGCLARS